MIREEKFVLLTVCIGTEDHTALVDMTGLKVMIAEVFRQSMEVSQHISGYIWNRMKQTGQEQ